MGFDGIGQAARNRVIAAVHIGVCGFLGGWLLGLFGVDVAGGGLIFSFLTCLLGAVILLWIVGLVTKRR